MLRTAVFVTWGLQLPQTVHWPRLLRILNAQRALRIIRDNGAVSWAEIARESFEEALVVLARALDCMVQVLDPEVIVVHGKVWDLIPDSIAKLEKLLEERVPLLYLRGAKQAGVFATILDRIAVRSLAEETV